MLSSRVAKSGPIAAAVWLSTVTMNCDVKPYDYLKDESVGLGAVDPVNFPPANLGDSGNRTKPGQGSFTEVAAFAGGEAIGYFAYPVNTPATRDPLRVLDANMPYPGVSTPTAYVFDATDAAPVPAKNRCTPPAGYDAKNPDLRLDPTPTFYQEQGNIFTDLPKATYNPGVAAASTYVPVVREARVSSKDHTCQELKSEKSLSDLNGGKPPKVGANYLAWLIVDPAAAVYGADGKPDNGVGTPASADMPAVPGLQKWGWFNRYLLAYLDGGYIPTADVDISNADMTMTKTVKRMVTQKLYVPLQVLDMDTMKPTEVEVGQGLDVLQAKRGTDGYSPVCEVLTYDATNPMTMIPPAAADLPKDAATIEMMFAATIKPASPHYMYCLQVR